MSPPTHLIILCCHAIYHPASLPHPPTNPFSEQNWLLAPFQTSESLTFTSHLRRAIELLLASPHSSLLVLSGSKTRPEVNLSEAASYLSLLLHTDFFGLCEFGSESEKEGFVRERILLEEQALDSFGNVVFSLVAFWRVTGRWPERVTVVSMGFKSQRIMNLHFGRALRWPLERVSFVGIDPGYMDPENEGYDEGRSEDVRRGEGERGFKAWEGDLFGTREELRGKRRGRNFWGVRQNLFESEEERGRSGLRTRVLEDGDREEVLVRGEIFPWEESL